MSFEVDMTGFQKAMKTYMVESGKSAKDVLKIQAQKLITSNAGDPEYPGVKRGGLYQECRKHAPATKAEIRGLKARLGYRIKRAPGVTVDQEIKRRLKHAGYVQSTGWLNRVHAIRGARGEKKLTLKLVGKPRGRVIQKLSGGNMSITIINETPGAAAFAAKTGYFVRAVANREADMAKYLQTKMLNAAKKSGFKVA